MNNKRLKGNTYGSTYQDCAYKYKHVLKKWDILRILHQVYSPLISKLSTP